MADVGKGTSSILSISSLTKRFGKTTAVDDISLEIPEGEFFTIVGPSSSGSTTVTLSFRTGTLASDWRRSITGGLRFEKIPMGRNP